MRSLFGPRLHSPSPLRQRCPHLILRHLSIAPSGAPLRCPRIRLTICSGSSRIRVESTVCAADGLYSAAALGQLRCPPASPLGRPWPIDSAGHHRTRTCCDWSETAVWLVQRSSPDRATLIAADAASVSSDRYPIPPS